MKNKPKENSDKDSKKRKVDESPSPAEKNSNEFNKRVRVDSTSANASPAPQKNGQREYFSRIDRSKISFDDPTLRDNTYKGAAGTWGQAASEKLGRVRGKDFTKNKNKMKKGSYRGGTITMESGSYKFTD